MRLIPATESMFKTADGRPTARSLVFQGVSPETFRLIHKWVGEQGSPTINRDTRRRSQRVGDRARRAKAKREQEQRPRSDSNRRTSA